MKRAIVVKGNSNSGKTTVLNDLYDWVKRTYNVNETFYKDHHNKDFESVMQIGKLEISFFTQGDYGHEVDRFLKDAIARNSDIIICCCRARGATSKAIDLNLIYPHFLVDFTRVHQVTPVSLPTFITQKLDELVCRLTGLS